jgi:L-cystine uptake protein TcyP (sodium:dicarboxylate symporter family)
MISDMRTVLFLAVFIVSLCFIGYLQKKKVSFTKRTLIAAVVAVILGVLIQVVAGMPEKPSEVQWINEVAKWYSLVGNGFISILKMIVIPMIMTSMIRVIVNLGSGENFKEISLKSVGVIVSTTAIAGVIGIIVAQVVGLGKGAQAVEDTSTAIAEIQPIVDTMLNLLPKNPFEAMVNMNVVGIIIFVTFIGLAIRRQQKKYAKVVQPFVDFIEAFYKIIISIAMTVIKFMPYAIVAMLSSSVATMGVATLSSVVKFLIALYIGLIILFAVQMIILSLIGLNPILYIKKCADPLIMAFSSDSSLATLPVTVKTLTNKYGLEENLGSFVASLTANIGLAACTGVFPALLVILVVNMLNIHVGLTFYVMLAIVISISSFGIAGIPGTSIVVASVVLSGVGLGEYFPLIVPILAIGPLMNLARTVMNVNTAMFNSLVVAKLTGKIDLEVYNKSTAGMEIEKDVVLNH